MNCRGLHCPGCHRRGPGAPITALLVLLALSAASRAVASMLPILLHLLIVTAITAASAVAVLTVAVLAVRRSARTARPSRQQLWQPPARAIRAPAIDQRELPATPRRRSLPASATVPDAPPPHAPHKASERTPPP